MASMRVMPALDVDDDDLEQMMMIRLISLWDDDRCWCFYFVYFALMMLFEFIDIVDIYFPFEVNHDGSSDGAPAAFRIYWDGSMFTFNKTHVGCWSHMIVYRVSVCRVSAIVYAPISVGVSWNKCVSLSGTFAYKWECTRQN